MAGALILFGDRLTTRGITYGTTFPPVANVPDDRYGVNVELDKIVSEDDLRRSLTMIKAAGFGYVRQVFAWNEIEISAKGDFYDHKNGKSAWEKYDRIVDQANAAGLQVIARLERPPDWSRTDNRHETRPPDNFQDYGDFVEAFVSHFKGRIHYIQIWNEPNRFEDWGYQAVDPAAYTRLLKIGYTAAKRVDPSIVVLSAALTPTTDCCVKNRPDPVYLQQMYDAGARGYFDVLGAQGYGLRAGPEDPWTDLPLHPGEAKKAVITSQNTNFGRVVLDREVMVRNGDAGKPVWICEFGWNALPPGWSGDASPWGSVTPRQQADYTVMAYQRARREWPWLGVMNLWLFQDPTPSPRDPTQFFGIVDPSYQPRPVYRAIEQLTHGPPVAQTGPHPAVDPAANFAGPWQAETSRGGVQAGREEARISPVSGAAAVLRFQGSAVALQAVRGPNMGIAYVTVDGSPTYATDVSKDSAGRAAIDLYAPTEQAETIAIASGLPYGQHELGVIVSGLKSARSSGSAVEIAGYTVGLTSDRRPLYFGAGLLAAGLFIAFWNALAAIRRPGLGPRLFAGRGERPGFDEAPASDTLSLAIPRFAPLAALAARFGVSDQQLPMLTLALGLAIFYFAPALPLALLGAVLFFLAALARLDLALLFVPLVAPFYLQAKHLRGAEVPLSEAVIGLCVAAYLLRRVWEGKWRWPRSRFLAPSLLFLAAATVSVLAAAFPRYALREYRTDVLEPLAFFYLIVLARPRPKDLLNWLLAGGVIVAIVGLAQYATGHGIQAEGVRRMVGVYRSPDNLGLYLARLAPIGAALALLGPVRLRGRILYAAVTGLMLLSVFLSFTKGAWLGDFAALLVVAGVAGWRWLVAVAGAGLAGLAGLSTVQARRIQSTFQFAPGSTTFSRLELWRATARMIGDHPLFGVGLDNFLYQYPHYILPEARNEPDLSHPHNVILDFWSRIGIFGLAALVWLEVIFFRMAARLARSGDALTRALSVGLLASMVDCLVHGLVDNSYFLIDLSLLFWLSLGVAQVLEFDSPRTED